ncbi:preprotein translocase subunit SecG [Candidatus Roizmanbacteria bacterium RIFCSPLOWO2_01_FULL_42_14]|uniref:Protein-export membrane protein SecG n=4 Tax=Candidatus Roizmaniibacteriota TaxID=1752723 RepID=A0A1F7JVQ2_9BACT|nr:MAG: preprotein translocase subunit SecG [Candidatus Roizmanbacteria bacterium RIFCSPHIGHO2_02_FULL_43_11]OGK37990.1 MAG: preprotein translocase subunit SecG [Candidatus Roizmanbacteria bacterium RIFCSPHIGHO2_12_FULL_42_10]OGK51574.1 MAG: preprotein translocase subunit SecG [Candidatus Roizmanbacteria bacterium RIFCSPLOWO2_01_FULL_42_14]OGK59696.1 MAG: preprotein translocase subunit SecG [Candidatus Roizmanbacteria bacterium RIFCSPLOWO2_02_FULL_43_10]
MQNALLVVTIVLGVVITALTLFQGKGGGLGSAWGGTGAGFQTRRGLEKMLLRLTAILIFLFFVVSVINVLL